MRRLLLLTLTIASLPATGCGSDSGSDSGSGATPAGTGTATQPATETQATKAPAETTKAKGTTIRISDSQFGKILFDADGQAIYLFDKEKSDKSECYDACADEWPPVFTDGTPRAGSGIDQGLLGTTERDDGRTQVTYNGHPLYYYAHEGPGEVKCHDVPGFGGTWLVLDGSGDAVA